MTIRRLKRDDWSGFCAHVTRGFRATPADRRLTLVNARLTGVNAWRRDSEDNRYGSFTCGATRVAAQTAQTETRS